MHKDQDSVELVTDWCGGGSFQKEDYKYENYENYL